jgi:hypothetical protein
MVSKWMRACSHLPSVTRINLRVERSVSGDGLPAGAWTSKSIMHRMSSWTPGRLQLAIPTYPCAHGISDSLHVTTKRLLSKLWCKAYSGKFCPVVRIKAEGLKGSGRGWIKPEIWGELCRLRSDKRIYQLYLFCPRFSALICWGVAVIFRILNLTGMYTC